jgi:intracellular sulfur oxidation DsrE/DsrF family protein
VAAAAAAAAAVVVVVVVVVVATAELFTKSHVYELDTSFKNLQTNSVTCIICGHAVTQSKTARIF